MASRQLVIQTNVVSRLRKEVESYQKEAEDQRRTADKMRADGADEYKVRQQQQALQETLVMIPNSQKRLGEAVQSLKELMAVHESELQGTDEFKKAEEQVEMAFV